MRLQRYFVQTIIAASILFVGGRFSAAQTLTLAAVEADGVYAPVKRKVQLAAAATTPADQPIPRADKNSGGGSNSGDMLESVGGYCYFTTSAVRETRIWFATGWLPMVGSVTCAATAQSGAARSRTRMLARNKSAKRSRA